MENGQIAMDDTESIDWAAYGFERRRRLGAPKKQFCKLGHPLSGENVRVEWANQDHTKKHRICVTCAKMHKAAHWVSRTPEQRAERNAKRRAARLNKKENP
jgi:hypothetical protein